MTCSISELTKFEVHARDGRVGRVKDVYFDDDRLIVRHLVVDTGGWITGRQVLVSPHAVERLDHDSRTIVANLSRDQIEKAPGIDTDKPVSRQHEMEHYDYYGYPYYWTGFETWGALAYPMAYAGQAAGAGAAGAIAADQRDAAPADRVAAEEREALRRASDPHLRSSSEVIGYHIRAVDGSIGSLDDLLFDEGTWRITQLIVDTGKWLPGKRVGVAAERLHGVDWAQREVEVNLTREDIKASSPADADGT
ncbi:PRC-barrel domain-containing protein [Ramlibacter sp. AN1015]|uniref:PRC-barrel domain-containing protein n=1 Tax=Ramlibacter sp. AN1015 TaxID=3133428 RepID=UPI0030BD843B